MIITKLTGGLGNQMFQYAAGLALAEARRTVLKLDVNWFREYPNHQNFIRYALSCLNVTEQFATAEEIERVRGLYFSRSERGVRKIVQALQLDGVLSRYSRNANWHHVPWAHFDEKFFLQPDNTYIEGYCHAEGYFANIADLVRQQFTLRYPAISEVAALEAEIAATESIAVHFRRGDYITNPSTARRLGAVGRAYYDRAFAVMRAQFPNATFYLFSDDIEAVAREITPPGPHHFVQASRPWHDHDALRLMSRCRHAIISNSTFAWWGAWLISSPNKIVIAPKPWCIDPNSKSHIVPSDWLEISRLEDQQ
ncbi:MAG: alpha-1,2-fucosyltransferase [Opitutaceae bacterium]